MRFHMRVTEKDLEGYYFPRWDRATPITIDADTRAEAFTKLWTVMGDCPRGRGWAWTAKIERIQSTDDKADA